MEGFSGWVPLNKKSKANTQQVKSNLSVTKNILKIEELYMVKNSQVIDMISKYDVEKSQSIS